MYYYLDGRIEDDGRGMATAPAYIVSSKTGARHELPPATAQQLTQAFRTSAIQAVKCSVCQNFAWSEQHDPAALNGAYHHPACGLLRQRLPFGDYIARASRAVGVQPCAPCKRRQAALNELGDRLMGFLGR